MRQKGRNDSETCVRLHMGRRVYHCGWSKDIARWFVYCALRCTRSSARLSFSSDLRGGKDEVHYLPLKNR